MVYIDGKTIWITGASSGIGEALAYELNRRKCKLILSARRERDLERVKANCKDPENSVVLPLDVTDLESMPKKTDKAIAAFGGIDILINNAGISQRSLIKDTDLAVYQKLMEVNYLGTIAITKAVLPHFLARKRGHFTTITSVMGKFASPLRSGYCGSKHALHGFFDALRMEHEKDGIDVTLICPGFVSTDIAKKALTANGNSKGTDDNATEKGMPVDRCACKITNAMERKKFEAYIGGKEVSGVFLKRLFPKLLHSIVLRSKVT